MELVVSGDGIRALTHILSCLYRLHDHCWMTVYREDPQQDHDSNALPAPQVHWSAVNPAGSAYGLFVLNDAFFDLLRPHPASIFECYVHVKTLLDVLRSQTKMHTCTVTAATDRLVFVFDGDHGVQKRHKLTYEDRPCVFPAVDMTSPYTLCVQPSMARDWTEKLLNTGKSGECSLHCTPTTCAIRSCVYGPLEGHLRHSIQTEVRISVEQLKEYAVQHDTSVYFSLWDFRAAISAAEVLGSHVRLEFAHGGDPLFLRLHAGDTLRGEFILATAGEPTAAPPPPTKKRAAPPLKQPMRRPQRTAAVAIKESQDDDALPVRPKQEPSPTHTPIQRDYEQNWTVYEANEEEIPPTQTTEPTCMVRRIARRSQPPSLNPCFHKKNTPPQSST